MYLEPGDVVIYPTGPVHEVTPVQGPRRRVAVVGWIESMVAEPEHRGWLQRLDGVRVALEEGGHVEEALQVTGVLQEAFRRFTR